MAKDTMLRQNALMRELIDGDITLKGFDEKAAVLREEELLYILELGKKAGIREVVDYAIACRQETQGILRQKPRKTWRFCGDRIIGYAQRLLDEPN